MDIYKAPLCAGGRQGTAMGKTHAALPGVPSFYQEGSYISKHNTTVTALLEEVLCPLRLQHTYPNTVIHAPQLARQWAIFVFNLN